jgi:lysophospholipase L1-like esterase
VVLVGLSFVATACASSEATSGLSSRASVASGPVLKEWRTALADRSSSPANWVAYGDSITEGQGASSVAERWVDQALDRLRREYPVGGVAGGVGYLPSWYATWGPTSPWTPYSARTGTIEDETWGSLGLRVAVMSPGATETYTVEGTSLDVYYVSNGGTFTYEVDGGAWTTVDASGRYTTSNSVRVVFPAAGRHTVTLAAGRGTADLEGVMVYDGDESNGVRLYDNAHSGITSGELLAGEGDIDPLLKSISPALVTICLGVNDYLHDAATPAQLTANLNKLISDIRETLSARPPSVVLVLPYVIGAAANRQGYTWAQYATAVRAVAAADPTVGMIDLSSMGTSRPGGYWASDGLHPSDKGQAEIAAMVTAYLSGRSA